MNIESIKLSKSQSTILKNYKPTSKILPKIAEVINKEKKFLLTTHIGADADGLGAQIGLYYLLKKLKKKTIILNNETPPDYLNFMLPEKLVQNINDYEEELDHLRETISDHFVFILDSSELKRSAKVSDLFQSSNLSWSTIDHHVLPKKKNFFVDSSYASTCEIIWDIYHYLGIKIPAEAALPLYVGMVADTGNFRYSKTTMRTHLAAGELIGYGIDTNDIISRLYESHPIDRIKLIQKVYKKAQIDKKRGLILSEIRPKMLRNLNLGNSPSEGIVNMFLAHKDVKVAVLMSESSDGQLKASLRSVGSIDVSSIAEKFNGGGHKNASGLKIKMPYRKARKELLKTLKDSIKINPS